MNSHQYELGHLHDRLLALEHQNRRFKRFGAALLVVLALVVVMGQAAPKKTIEANEFTLKDESGNIRARLFVTAKTTTKMTVPGFAEPVPVTYQAKPTLALYDEKGQANGIIDDDSVTFIKSRVSLSGGVLSLGDQTSAVVVSPYSVALFDEQGFETTLGRRALVTPRSGETQMRSAASIVMFDKNKNVIWKVP